MTIDFISRVTLYTGTIGNLGCFSISLFIFIDVICVDYINSVRFQIFWRGSLTALVNSMVLAQYHINKNNILVDFLLYFNSWKVSLSSFAFQFSMINLLCSGHRALVRCGDGSMPYSLLVSGWICDLNYDRPW